MSAAQSHLDTKPLPAAEPRMDASHSVVAPEHHSPLRHVFHPQQTNDDLYAGDTLHNPLGAAHFGAEFDHSSHQGLQGLPSLGSLHGEHAAGLLSNAERHPMLASGPDVETAPATSITALLPPFGGTDSPRARSTMEGSDDESPGGQPRGSSLEDPLANDFTFSSTRRLDLTDLGGKPKDDKSDSTPAWSELKTKAGKERKRLPLACITCRRKKIRCSGEKPACKHCQRARIPCVYRTTARKAAPRTDYMAMLDRRLKRMEDRILKVIPKTEHDGLLAKHPRAILKPSHTMTGELSSGKKGSRKRGAEEAFGGRDLDLWAKHSSRPRLSSPAQPDAALMMIESEERRLLQEGQDALPTMEMQEHLADVFFASVYGQAYHILHKPSYMRKLRSGQLPPVLILSVCAISARFSVHPRLNLSSGPMYLRGEEWAAAAREIVIKRYEWPNITILICLLILGLHEFATCHGGRSWALGGAAMRMAFALSLHKDLDHDPLKPNTPLSFVDREIRRRTMWACFIMDRFNSSGIDRPHFIKEEALQIPLPVKEKNFMMDMPAPTENLHGKVPDAAAAEERGDVSNPRENMGVAAYIIKAISIFGRVVTYLNQGGKDMDASAMWEPDSVYTQLVKQAEDMITSLPEDLVFNEDNLHLHDTESMANQFVFLHVAMQHNVLFLNRFATSSANNTPEIPPTSFITKAGRKAFGAANRISELLKASEPYSVTAPFAGYCAFLSSTVHIFGIHTSHAGIQNTSKANLAINIAFLNKMKRHWGIYESIIEELREQYRKGADRRRKEPNDDSTSIPSIFQYGDWFDRYPHGVSQSDFVDPALYKKRERGEDAVLEEKADLHTVEQFFSTLSPQSKDGSARSNSGSNKQKPIAAKRNSSRGGHHHENNHQLEPIMTDLPDQLARLQQQSRFSNVTMGPVTSGTPGFLGLGAPHSASYGAAQSPISPMGMGHSQFAGHHHNSHDLLHHPLLAMQLAQNNMHTQQMLGSFNNSAQLGQAMEGLSGWSGPDNAGHGAREGSRGAAGSGAGADGPHNNPHHTIWGHGHDLSSDSWLTGFNLNAPELSDLSGLSGVDGFGSMFNTGNSGRN